MDRNCILSSITTNISLEVTQVTWPDTFKDPSALVEHCLCISKLLLSTGIALENTSGDLCVHEEAGAGVACIAGCLTNNNCSSGSCPPTGSAHLDICGLYDKNQTSEFANICVLNIGLDCRTISQHVIDVCSSILSQIGE